MWFVAVYHTHQPCPKCRCWLDKIRYEKRIRVRTGVSYRMVCPSCGWSDGPDLSRAASRAPGASVAPPYLRFHVTMVVPGEVETITRRAQARADIAAMDDGYVITLSPAARRWDPEAVTRWAESFGWRLVSDAPAR